MLALSSRLFKADRVQNMALFAYFSINGSDGIWQVMDQRAQDGKVWLQLRHDAAFGRRLVHKTRQGPLALDDHWSLKKAMLREVDGDEFVFSHRCFDASRITSNLHP